jgi:hypothetical protein
LLLKCSQQVEIVSQLVLHATAALVAALTQPALTPTAPIRQLLGAESSAISQIVTSETSSHPSYCWIASNARPLNSSSESSVFGMIIVPNVALANSLENNGDPWADADQHFGWMATLCVTPAIRLRFRARTE